VILLGEEVRLTAVLGLALILGGVALGARRRGAAAA
jgi:drug/metabolite transporter (DMT)-like permease